MLCRFRQLILLRLNLIDGLWFVGPRFDGPGVDGPGVDGPGFDGPRVDGPGVARVNAVTVQLLLVSSRSLMQFEVIHQWSCRVTHNTMRSAYQQQWRVGLRYVNKNSGMYALTKYEQHRHKHQSQFTKLRLPLPFSKNVRPLPHWSFPICSLVI